MKHEIQQLVKRLNEVETESARYRTEARQERCRARMQAVLAVAAVAGAILLSPANRAVIAQGGRGLEQRVEALENTVAAIQAKDASQDSQTAALQARDSAQDSQIAALQASDTAQNAALSTLQAEQTHQSGQIAGLEGKTRFISVGIDPASGTLDMYISRTNLHILNGGTAYGANGLGNLILGYNLDKPFQANVRTGSHNIVFGDFCSYSGLNGLVGGMGNSIESRYGCILTGLNNAVTGPTSAVVGGNSNLASGDESVVVGGGSNTATGDDGAVLGGFQNSASGVSASSVGGGRNQDANLEYEFLPKP